MNQVKNKSDLVDRLQKDLDRTTMPPDLRELRQAGIDKLAEYEQWFQDNAVNLAIHRIGGYSISGPHDVTHAPPRKIRQTSISGMEVKVDPDCFFRQDSDGK